MKYVYMLESISFPDRHYVGSAIDIKRRVGQHNRGESLHTGKFRPWRVVCYVAFLDHQKANRFEAYLKTASGRSFAKRHF